MLQKNCKKCCVVAIGSYIGLASSDKVAQDWHVRCVADKVDVTSTRQARAMLQKNCKKCCVVAIGSCIERAFSNKVAEDWHVRLRCRQGGRHIDEANQSNVANELQKVLRCGYWKLH